jgi:CelD/BcsL family acetyltransferase involved in cellulose biosynthesis
MTGRDETFEAPPAGMILHAYSIRHAIKQGFIEYDFLRGNEPYKYAWGAVDEPVHRLLVTRGASA